MRRAQSTTKVEKRAPLPLLSYKAEIIWDPQPAFSDEINEQQSRKLNLQYRNEHTQKNIISQSQKKIGGDEKISLPPFVNLERDNYIQDIARRKFYFNTLKAEQDTLQFQNEIQQISKDPPKKKTRRHKTKFRIIKNNQNIKVLQGVLVDYINQNKKFVNTEVLSLPNYEKSAPFLPSTVEFADQLIEEKEFMKEKYGFDEKNLIKNHCVLEQVMLMKLEKRLKNREKNKQLKKPLEQDQPDPIAILKQLENIQKLESIPKIKD